MKNTKFGSISEDVKLMTVTQMKEEIKAIRAATGTNFFKGYSSASKGDLQSMLIKWYSQESKELQQVLEYAEATEKAYKSNSETAATVDEVTLHNVVNVTKSKLTGDKALDRHIFENALLFIESKISEAIKNKKRSLVGAWKVKFNIIKAMFSAKIGIV